MITYQKEQLFMVADEVDDLLQLHYQELCLNQDRIKLNPDWTKYAALEVAEILHIFTARKDGKIIGYAVFFVQPHLHYMDLKTAVNDILFIHPEERNSSGLRLIKFCEKELAKFKEDGQELKIVWRAKFDTILHKLLPKLGYSAEEIALAKLL